MQLVSDPSFDDRQQRLTTAIVEAIARELHRVEAPEDLIEELTGSIAFSVASLIDAAASVDFEGGSLGPILTFRVGETQLAYAGGNTWMHEYVYRLLPAVLKQLNIQPETPK